MSRYRLFERHGIVMALVAQRGHDLLATDCRSRREPPESFDHADLPRLVDAIRAARQAGRPVLLFMGGHPIKVGLAPLLIDLMQRGWLTHLATNGAGLIHDFELAVFGGTSEDVAKWIRVGQFGLWQETSRLNDVIAEAARSGEGLGEALGRVIEQERFPHRDLSVAAAGWRLGIPVTAHVTIGGDIIHAMPNCDGAALGQASYTDFLIFARSVQDLSGGVFVNLGSAVTGPEVFLKALSMARNVARQEGKDVSDFTTAVFDLVPLPENYRDGPPPKDDPLYYFRPWKTLLCRTVSGGGRSFYFCGDHRDTVPALWQHLVHGQ